MANADTPFGLKPAYHLMGVPLKPSAIEYTVETGYNANIFTGDLVDLADESAALKLRVSGASDTKFQGVFAGCKYKNSSGEIIWSRYWPASTTATEIVAYVYDDPYIVYEIQHNGTGATTDYGAMADLTTETSGNTTTGVSGMELKTSDIGTGINLKILGPVPRPDNAVGLNQKVYVLINEHALRGTLQTT